MEQSQEYYIKEIKKCSNDPQYFISNYCTVIDPEKGRIPFKLFDYQEKYIKHIFSNKYSIIDKARQLGFSYVTAAVLVWFCSFHKNKETAIVSMNDKEAKYFLGRAFDIYDNLPKWLVGKVQANEHRMLFDTGSSIEAMPNTKRTLRGRTVSMAIIDEAAFQQYITDLWKAASPSLSKGEHLVVISTRNGTEGIGSWYYNMLEDAKSGENEFKIFETDWWECPMYNPDAPNFVNWEENKWATEMRKTLKDIGFRQEILREWIVSGDTVLPQSILIEMNAIQPIRMDFLKDVDYTPEDVVNFPEYGWDKEFGYIKGLWIWKEPVPGHFYSCGIDLATGNGKDYTTIFVLDLNTMEQVAEYRNRISSNFTDKVVLEICNYYNQAFIAMEINTTDGILNDIINTGYEHFYMRPKTVKSKIMIPGWRTDLRTRPLLVNRLQEVIFNKSIKIKSGRLISELKTFVWLGGKAQAAKQAHDDLVFAFMITLKTIEQAIENMGANIDLDDMKENKTESEKMNDFIGILQDEINLEGENFNNNKVNNKPISKEELEKQYNVDTSNWDFFGIENGMKK